MEKEKQIEKDFKKVIGYEPIKLVLERILDMIRNREKYDKLGTRLPSGVLLSGEPGTGKTLIANSFVEASKLPFYLVKKDCPDGDFVKYIKQSFESAKKNAPSIVFLDDMDKFANEDDFRRDAEEYVTIQACIDDVKGKDVFVIATVNNLNKLPNSLYRSGRFDKNLKLEIPTGEDAIQIIDYYIKQKNIDADVDCEEIGKMLNGESCAVLETVINEAAVFAGFEGKEKITKKDLLRAAMCVIFKAPESARKKSIQLVKKIAYHEAGHTVVAELLEPGSISLVSVLGHDGATEGVTVFYQENEKYFSSIEFMKNRVRSLLAGKAATEIVFGEVDVGAKSDTRRAINISERFVDDYCGFGYDKFEFQQHSSNELLARKEMFIFSEIEKYYQEAKKLLIDNREFLDKVAEKLVENETLTCKDIYEIKKSCTIIV